MFILPVAAPLHAETYSWIDDSGTYNFTEDYSAVPKKYRKKVKQREDVHQQAASSPVVHEADGKSKPIDKKDEKAAASDEKKLYGGKTFDAWRKEMDVQEAELKRIESRMEEIRKQINDTRAIITDARYNVLKKEYDDYRADYEQKYKRYTDLMDTIRKTGISVGMK